VTSSWFLIRQHPRFGCEFKFLLVHNQRSDWQNPRSW